MQQQTIAIHDYSKEQPLPSKPTEQFIVWTETGPHMARYDIEGFYGSRGSLISGVVAWMQVPDPALKFDAQPDEGVFSTRRKRVCQAYPLTT